MRILLFPGQGAQKVGMAQDLANDFPEAAATLESIDAALGTSLTELMFAGPSDELVLTHNTQPAILAHSAAVLSVIQDRLSGTVVAGAGHSLGEYSAWMAAGSLAPPVAAQLVRERGTLMHSAGAARPGAMSAIIGLDSTKVAQACAEASSTDTGVAVPANLNGPDQTVISGDPAAVEQAGFGCKGLGARRVVPLNVGGAFHSPLMEPAVAGLRAALDGIDFAPAAFGVVANATAEVVEDAGQASALLADQLTSPVRWVESIELMAERWPDAEWLEIGPGSVLSGLLRKIKPELRATSLGTTTEIQEWLSK